MVQDYSAIYPNAISKRYRQRKEIQVLSLFLDYDYILKLKCGSLSENGHQRPRERALLRGVAWPQ